MEQYDAEQRALGQAMSSGLTQMAGAANFSQAMNFYGKQGMGGVAGASNYPKDNYLNQYGFFDPIKLPI